MRPVHDVDAVLILSLSVASKRRPANLVEIVAATELAQGRIPAASQLSAAFARLSACGLVLGSDGGYTLSADAQEMLASQRRNDDNEKKLARLKEHLAGYRCNSEHPTIRLDPEQLLAATNEHKADNKGAGKNLLTSRPKPKPAWIPKKDLVQGRQHLPSKRRKP